MKKKFLLMISMLIVFCCFFAISINAATTNEFGTPEIINGIDLTGMNEDTVARVVIVDANGAYHTYPAQYVVSSNTKFYYNFKPINSALGTNYNKHSIIRIEVPDNIQIATNCGDLSQTNNMVEIKFSPSSELHTLEYGCFYANKKLQKLNIPPKVTTMGTLLINNSTLEELIFMDGFSAIPPKDSFCGAIGVKRVVFSNQMTTMGNRAFNATLGESLEEFYFGASLMDLGTENASYVKQSVKFYIPAQFLSEADEINMTTYSWWSSTACLPTGVIFFTGTKEQAQALINKSTYDRVFSSNSELVEWDSSVTDDEYVPSKGWRIVYGYNTCRAFYENAHDMNGKNTPNVKSYFEKITVGDMCKRCLSGIVSEEIDPLFVCKGYTVSTFGDTYSMAQGFSVNNEAIELYKKYVPDFEFGLIVAGNKDKGEFAPSLSGDLCIPQNKLAHDYFDIKITGITSEHVDKIIVFCAYAKANGNVYYLDNYTMGTKVIGTSYNAIAKPQN